MMVQLPNELIEKVYEAVEIAKSTGSIKKGTNEVTKAIERGTAKLVVYAEDVNPKEIIMHIPLIAKERNIPCVSVPSKEELGTAASLPVGTASVAIVKEGESKKILKELFEVINESNKKKDNNDKVKEEKKEEKEDDSNEAKENKEENNKDENPKKEN